MTSNVPAGLKANVVNDGTEINLTWKNVTNATGYDMEIDGVVVENVTSPYTHTGFAADSTHIYKVRSKINEEYSNWSSLVRITKGYGYTDNLSPSQNAPGGLNTSEVPQFVAFGFDDNGMSGLEGSPTEFGGLKFIVDIFSSRKNPKGTGNRKTYDGSTPHFTFFGAGKFIGAEGEANWDFESTTYVKKAWNYATVNGNEIGNHTYSHAHGASYSQEIWEAELKECFEWQTKPFAADESVVTPDNTKGAGAEVSQILGFRAPYLEFNDETFKVLQNQGYLYDCTITEGTQADQDGTNFFWPYTLNNGSPADASITNHPGLWEMPVHVFMVPPDNLSEKYGVDKGLRDRIDAISNTFDPTTGKVTGLDWNLWIEYKMTKEEFVATLKYTLDLRLEGNRAPLLMGFHSDMYSDRYNDIKCIAKADDRRAAIVEFLDYALSKEAVRVTSYKEVIDWLRDQMDIK